MLKLMDEKAVCRICQNCHKCVNGSVYERKFESASLCSCKKYFDFQFGELIESEISVCSYKCCFHRRVVCKSISKRRDRAPSRISLKKINSLFLKKRGIKRRITNYIKYNVPGSSRLRNFLCSSFRAETQNRYEYVSFLYLKFRFKMVNICRCYFAQSHCDLRRVRKYEKLKKNTVCLFVENVFELSKFRFVKKIFVLDKMLLLCGDIETNPGPVVDLDKNIRAIDGRSCNSALLLTNRLRELDLAPFDCGGNGDCFFRSVSHQIFGSAVNHLAVRLAGVEYLRNHPEEFIQFLAGQSWSDYLNDVCREGTWCDALIVQAVANAYNLRINIVESALGFCEETVVDSRYTWDEMRSSIVIGHIDEHHYVSTIPFCYSVGNQCCNNEVEHVSCSMVNNCDKWVSNEVEGMACCNENYSDSLVAYKNCTSLYCSETIENYNERCDSNEDEHMSSANDRLVSTRNETILQCHETMENDNECYHSNGDENMSSCNDRFVSCTNDTSLQCDGTMENDNECYRSDDDKNVKRKRSLRHVYQIKEKCRKRNETQKGFCSGKSVTREEQGIRDVEKLIKCFHSSIKRGPEYICTCCDQLWYRSSVKKCVREVYSNCSLDIIDLCITNVVSVDSTEWICLTCHSCLMSGKLPVCAKANGMSFPVRPEVLNLTSLEERLVAPRICFMQLRELPRGRQLKICGAVVNVPADVNSSVSSLPRVFDDSFTVAVKLKIRLAYKYYYQFEVVRPKKVLDAARYLVNKSELFKNEGIQVSDSWVDAVERNNSAEWSEFVEGEVSSNVCCERNNEDTSESNDAFHCNSDGTCHISENDDQWCEVDERPSGVTDTLLQDPDPIQDVDKIINIAPAEGARPLGLFIDKDSEFLAFPTIFCGERRCENKDRVKPVHYSTICKWELRNRDRRVAQSVSNIFYKLKKLQIKRIQDTASLSLRKCKTKGRKVTAGDLKSPDTVNNLIQLDEGFRVLRDVRGSPAYFERCKKDLFAMIRQLGNPTWFCSFSAAETRWHHPLKMLGRLIDYREYSDNEINEMNWEKKSRLIQKDPVTCARNFDYMVQRLIYDILKSDLMPVGEIADFFYRVEFQQRGSPHIHALLWIKSAPLYELNSNNEIIEFADKYLTCKKNTSVEMVDLVNLQTHRHAKTCKKKGQKICRFNFPLPPMRRTMILSPLSKES